MAKDPVKADGTDGDDSLRTGGTPRVALVVSKITGLGGGWFGWRAVCDFAGVFAGVSGGGVLEGVVGVFVRGFSGRFCIFLLVHEKTKTDSSGKIFAGSNCGSKCHK